MLHNCQEALRLAASCPRHPGMCRVSEIRRGRAASRAHRQSRHRWPRGRSRSAVCSVFLPCCLSRCRESRSCACSAAAGAFGDGASPPRGTVSLSPRVAAGQGRALSLCPTATGCGQWPGRGTRSSWLIVTPPHVEIKAEQNRCQTRPFGRDLGSCGHLGLCGLQNGSAARGQYDGRGLRGSP